MPQHQQAVLAGTGASPPRGRGPVVAALMLAMALAAMDSTIISTVVPQIVGDLGGFSVFSWLFSGYLLAVTVTLPVYGKLADMFGRKPVLISGIALFLLGSLLCAGAWDMASLIAFRVIQGLGGGAIQGTVQTVAADLYALRERAKIQAAISTVWAVSAIAGPLAGGLLAEYADWRWIFLVNVPIGLMALLLIVRHLRESGSSAGTQTRRSVDWPGALGLFVSGGVVLFALVQGGVAWGWLSWQSLILFGAGAAGAVVTVWIERHAAEPIIPGWVWRRRVIASVNLALGALGVVIIAPTVFMPIYGQTVLGLGPVQAGFVLSVMSLSWPMSAAFSNRVYMRIGFRDTALIGITAGTAILLALTLLPNGGPAWQPALVMLLLGGALGLFQLPLIVGVQSTVRWAERGTATSSILFCRQVGQSVGAAVFGAVANAALSGTPGGVAGLRGLNGASEAVRRAVGAAVNHVYVGAVLAAGVAVLVLVFVMPRRFPVLAEGDEG
ncbi:MFS transporter [Actinacidiphila oryziradicis]|uniref:MFS transporter n=1 Tax=Actinacidiphila oryziradicis TaxID=2571141 RepID=A0A4U0SNZ3_9ACTN|nr:MFS transporter [Actinacidiphila oryziradicis]TKA10017.1 MFS transporter [Actinacidiphila oryziradicis]